MTPTHLTLQAVVDGLLPVNDVLLQVVRDHSLHRLNTKLLLDYKYQLAFLEAAGYM